MNPLEIKNQILQTINTGKIKLSNNSVTVEKANKILFKIIIYKQKNINPQAIILQVLTKYGKYGQLTTSMLLNELINYEGTSPNYDIKCPPRKFHIDMLPDPFWKNTDISCPFPTSYYINIPLMDLVSKYDMYMNNFITLYKQKTNIQPLYKLPHSFCEHAIKNGECAPLHAEGAVLYYKTLNNYFYTLDELLYTLTDYIPDFILYIDNLFIICKNFENEALIYIASQNELRLNSLYKDASDINKTWVCSYAFMTKDIFILKDISLTNPLMCVTANAVWLATTQV